MPKPFNLTLSKPFIWSMAAVVKGKFLIREIYQGGGSGTRCPRHFKGRKMTSFIIGTLLYALMAGYLSFNGWTWKTSNFWIIMIFAFLIAINSFINGMGE